MNMQLDTSEVQVAITEYSQQVRLEIVNHQGARIEIVGCAAVVAAINIKLPEKPYR